MGSKEIQEEVRAITGTVVLAYSGGLDTSVMAKWIQEKYGAEVITVTVDVGQLDDMKEIEKRSKAVGAKKHYSIDAKKEFVTEYVYPAIRANALYEGKYPLSSALSRPLIAQKLVEIALKEGASAVAHGCTGRGNDQVRFDVTIKSLAPHLKIIAPVREWGLTREEEIKYAVERGIEVPCSDKPYSIDQNLWGRAIECGILDDPDHEPPDEVFEWTVSPEKAPEKPEYVAIDFENGVPIAINGEELDPVKLIGELNKIAGRNGVGRIDHIEDRLVGLKSREVYECPAATVILEAHKDLEKMVLTRHEVLFKQQIDSQWTFLAYAGLWLDPLKEDLEAFINKTQERVNGKVHVKLYKGGLRVVRRSSKFSIYSQNLVNYNIKTSFNQVYAEGFIELWGLPTTVYNALKNSLKGGRNV
ncbi:MAG: argininosuccinate synthase [Nitrososphaerota archaeon]|nr:argininosuccinate synthase [Nitrososphaerota archaeon]